MITMALRTHGHASGSSVAFAGVSVAVPVELVRVGADHPYRPTDVGTVDVGRVDGDACAGVVRVAVPTGSRAGRGRRPRCGTRPRLGLGGVAEARFTKRLSAFRGVCAFEKVRA